MCGIVGMLGTIGNSHDKMFKDLLILDSLRGEHSTGVLFVPGFGEELIHKRACNPYDFFEYTLYNQGKNRLNKALLGHNRYATTGKIIHDNAHPFECQHIIGVHNGTLINKNDLDDSSYYDVDSENLFHHMSLHGVDETIPILRGAFALVWYDKNQRTMNFIRNEDRPLFIARDTVTQNVYWASEAWMLNVAASRRGIKIGQPELLNPGRLVSFDVPTNVNDPKQTGKAYLRDIKLYTPPLKTIANKVANIKDAGGHQAKKSSKALSQDQFKKYSERVGSTIEMIITGESEFMNNRYVTAECADDRSVKVRIHVASRPNLLEELLASSCNYRGKVKRANKNLGGYLGIDLRTLEEIVEGEVIETCKGHLGKEITTQEFVDLTENGCVMCQVPAFFDEADKLRWVGIDSFLCEDCTQDEDLIGYLNGHL